MLLNTLFEFYRSQKYFMHKSKTGLFYFIVPRYNEKRMLIFSVKRFIRETIFFPREVSILFYDVSR